jgi:hypothetical protein
LAIQKCTLLNHKNCRVEKVLVGNREHIATDVERVGVDPKRIVVQKLIVAAPQTNLVLLNKEQRPVCARRDYTIAGGIRHGNQHAVWNVRGSFCAAAGNIDHLQEPPFR